MLNASSRHRVDGKLAKVRQILPLIGVSSSVMTKLCAKTRNLRFYFDTSLSTSVTTKSSANDNCVSSRWVATVHWARRQGRRWPRRAADRPSCSSWGCWRSFYAASATSRTRATGQLRRAMSIWGESRVLDTMIVVGRIWVTDKLERGETIAFESISFVDRAITTHPNRRTCYPRAWVIFSSLISWISNNTHRWTKKRRPKLIERVSLFSREKERAKIPADVYKSSG